MCFKQVSWLELVRERVCARRESFLRAAAAAVWVCERGRERVLGMTMLFAGTAGGMELDAFEVKHARVSVLKDMGVLLYLSTAPPSGMSDLDFDVILCSGWGINVVCKVPKTHASVKDFVHEFCFLVSVRCKAVAPPSRSWLDGKRKTFVCKRSREYLTELL
jgi:hypothetical protein